MSSKNIVAKRKEIEARFKAEANIINGQLSEAKEHYDYELKELQKECKHVWDSGEYAVQKVGKINLCPICRKKT